MNTTFTELANLKPAMLDAGKVFSGKASGTLVKSYAAPTAYTPAIDPDYVFHESSRDVIVWFCNPTEPLYVFGPTGCGKTSCVRQLAARLNYPVFEVTGHGRLEFADFAGHLSVKNGDMSFEYGPLALAMRYGGLFLLNEIDLTPPEVAAGLNGILDGSPLCIPENGGELVRPHPLFRFAATANTNGGGDETGLYQGTQRQNLAFADRFILCEMGYPAAAVERALLRRRFPALPASLCKTMVDYANEVRRLFMGDAPDAAEGIEVTFSTRSLLRWGELTVRFQPLAKQGIQPITYALNRALAYRAVRDVAKLTKLINSLTEGQVTLEIDAQGKEETHKAKLMSADGSSATFTVSAYSDIPDFSPIIARAEEGLAQPPKLTNVYIPVAEMLRAGKVFPAKDGRTARICASKRKGSSGCLALLEYRDKEDDLDIRVIFMLTEPESAPNANSNAQAKAA